MITRVLYIGIIFTLSACAGKVDSGVMINENTSRTFAEGTEHLKDTISINSPPMEQVTDTTVIANKQYISYQSENLIYVLNEMNDTVFKSYDMNNGSEFEDFNGDGYFDIIIHYITNVPNIYDLALYDQSTRSFQLVEDFQNYPTPVKIGKTKFYYSYHRSGCADSNWDSDLFKIENYRAVRYGNIEGIGCEGESKNGIFISKIHKGNLTLIKSIQRAPDYYLDKWDFIRDYWTKNYSKFK